MWTRNSVPADEPLPMWTRLSPCGAGTSVPADTLSLNPRRPAGRKRANLFDRRHRRIAGERGQQGTMRPPELDRFFRRRARQQAVEEPRCEAVAAAHAI